MNNLIIEIADSSLKNQGCPQGVRWTTKLSKFLK
uniref:Uncharacterized protein n=1 Tax=Lepeophtheirus salmonis TaxID=72036 RepID=A0A0K2UBR6_LEPSM